MRYQLICRSGTPLAINPRGLKSLYLSNTGFERVLHIIGAKIMTRIHLAVLLSFAAFTGTAAQAQGPVQRAGQALDNAGRNIRRGVEGAVARGQITAQERDLLGRVSQRLTFDKQMMGSAMQLTVRADGAVILQGSVMDEPARKRAVDLAQSTVGVTAVIDELALAKDVRVIETVPARVIIVQPVETKVIVPPSRVVAPPTTEIIVPVQTKVIERR